MAKPGRPKGKPNKVKGPKISLESQLGLLPTGPSAPKPKEKKPESISSSRKKSLSADAARARLEKGSKIPTSRFTTEDFEKMMSQAPGAISNRNVSRQLKDYVDVAPELKVQESGPIPPITPSERKFYSNLDKQVKSKKKLDEE